MSAARKTAAKPNSARSPGKPRGESDASKLRRASEMLDQLLIETKELAERSATTRDEIVRRGAYIRARFP
jgi:hypothetical protein